MFVGASFITAKIDKQPNVIQLVDGETMVHPYNEIIISNKKIIDKCNNLDEKCLPVNEGHILCDFYLWDVLEKINYRD